MSRHWIYGFSASYNEGQWSIRQRLMYWSLYSFEGDFDQAINFLLKEQEECKNDYLSGPCKICKNNCVPELAYKETEVVFEKLMIEVGPNDEGNPELQIWGHRKPNEIELAWLEQERLAREEESKEERRKQFEKLQKEFLL